MDDAVSAEIEMYRALLPFIPLSHPFRPRVIAALASALSRRFELSSQEHDILALIPLLAEALLLPLGPVAARLFYPHQPFYKLARSLAFRFGLHHDLEDLEHAIKYLRYILTLPLRALGGLDTLEVAGDLTTLLGRGVQVGAMTGVQSDVAEEMVRILQMAAATDPSSQHVETIAESAGRILIVILRQCEQRSESEHILELFEEIEKVCPAERSPEFCVHHGVARYMYTQQTMEYDHCKKTVAQFNKALAHLPPGHPLHPIAHQSIAVTLYERSRVDEDVNPLEEAIHHARAALDACPPDHPMRPICLMLISRSLKRRYMFSGHAMFLREAEAYSQEALSHEFPEHLRELQEKIEGSNVFVFGSRGGDSLGVLSEQIRLQRGQLARISMSHSDRLDALHDLARACAAKFQHTGVLKDLEEEIHHHSLALAASPPDCHVRRMSLIGLGKAFQNRFLFDKGDEMDVRYLEQSIKSCRDALEVCPRGQASRSEPLRSLAISLFLRSRVFGDGEGGFEESMSLFQSALEDEYTHPHARFVIAGQWATCARLCQHSMTVPAYEKAMSLMQGSLTVGPTLEVQHWLLKGQLGGNVLAIPLEYASYHIEMGSPEQAVETLEQGRALLWSEMRGLRTPIDHLRASKHAMLAERFVAISNELESIATSSQPPPEKTSADASGGREIDAFGLLMKNARRLEQERGEIIDQIRHLPGFEDFLKAIPFKTLQTAAAYGPVVIINHCALRSDILIVLKDSAPVLIPTAKDFYTRAIALKQSLLETRTKHVLDSGHYQDVLRDVLQELYELVGRPVIEELRKLGIPEQSRVWWCPTSVFCSFPLHAAGPVEPENGAKRYFSDIYISSYTQTLSALIEARKGITDTLERPSLLILGQPDETLPGVKGEIKVIQRLAPSVSSLIGAKATRARVIKHLPKYRMAHFACHGTLNSERPFDAAFILDREERLTLLDILRSRSSTAEFAFLSVCHAAEWTDEQAPDEALHLAAAMQHCGFRSAVGTLWAMADIDGRDISEYFYRHMFAEGEQGVRIGDRSAIALRNAVQRLRRKKGVTFERWVNFVHYGA